MIRVLFVCVALITVILLSPALAGMEHRMGGPMPMGGNPRARSLLPASIR